MKENDHRQEHMESILKKQVSEWVKVKKKKVGRKRGSNGVHVEKQKN